MDFADFGTILENRNHELHGGPWSMARRDRQSVKFKSAKTFFSANPRNSKKKDLYSILGPTDLSPSGSKLLIGSSGLLRSCL